MAENNDTCTVAVAATPDEELQKFLSGVSGVVEANSFEVHCLWEKYKDSWKQNCSGLMETVGYVDGRPICVSLFTNEVRGQKILFFDATSQLVDHLKIDAWLDAVVPQSAYVNGRINRADAMNFHNVFHRVADAAAA